MKELTESELQVLFKKHVKKSQSYFQKYTVLPPCSIQSWNYSWGNNDFPRVWCVLDFQEWVQKYNIRAVNTLGYTCKSDPELEFISAETNVLVNYPPYDLHSIAKHFSDTFDMFIFNQTLEHLYNPYAAVEQIFQCMKPGGFVFTSVPTLNIPHMTPIHFGGMTPMGLATCFTVCGFEVLEIGQWGNFEYIQRLWRTHRWPGYNDLQQNNQVSNEEANVCQCWILARKPLN
jgi:SAM-dependent methyltransferase